MYMYIFFVCIHIERETEREGERETKKAPQV